MMWSEEKQARLDELRGLELSSTLSESDEVELTALLDEVEAEERARLTPVLAQMRAEQAVLQKQVNDSEISNDQLAALASQQEQLLADARKFLSDLGRRQQVIRDKYFLVTGEALTVSA